MRSLQFLWAKKGITNTLFMPEVERMPGSYINNKEGRPHVRLHVSVVEARYKRAVLSVVFVF